MTMCYTVDETSKLHVARPDAYACCLAKKVTVPQVKPGRFSVMSKSTETLVDAIDLWNPSCFDTLDVPGGYTPMLKNAISDTVSSEPCGRKCPLTKPFCRKDGTCIDPVCADVAEYCRWPSVLGVRARQLCPLTCQCHEPRSGLASGSPREGCGGKCMRLGSYLQKRRELPCEDVQKDDPAWIELLDDFDMVRKTWPQDWNFSSAAYLIQPMRELGCSFFNTSNKALGVAYFASINFCVELATYYPVKPLSYFCPVSCGCRRGDKHCPDTCPARTTSTGVCPTYQRNLSFVLPRHQVPCPHNSAELCNPCPMSF